MSSLVGAIFGKASAAVEKDDKAAGASSSRRLSNLFDQKSSSSLPSKPRHTAATKQKSRVKLASDVTTVDPFSGKKKKTRKRKQIGGDESAHPQDDVAAKHSKTTHADTTTTNTDEDDVDQRTVFVGNLPLSTTRKSLAALFKSCGKVESARLRSVAAAGVKLPPEQAGNQNLVKKVCGNTHKLDTDVKSTAQGYVVFCNEESAETALKLNNTLVDGSHRLRVDHATPTMDASRSVFCGNLPYHADETSLQVHFAEKCGFSATDIEGVRIIRDKDTMQCRGFGYVLFANKSMVATALQKMNGSLKRELRVTVCGKRYKGRRGAQATKEGATRKRSFEGRRASAAPATTGAMKRILGKKVSKGADSVPPPKKRRARGDQKKSTTVAKKGAHKAGVSRRAAAQAKMGKRIKKIQKRVSKGMGKARGSKR